VSTITLRATDREERAVATEVSDNYFPVLGILPALGRLAFAPAAAGRRPGRSQSRVLETARGRPLDRRHHRASERSSRDDRRRRTINVRPDAALVWEPDVWMPFTTAQSVLGAPPRRCRTEPNDGCGSSVG
jgi:hypothetical protein